MKETLKITVDTESEEFKEVYSRMEKIASSLGTFQVFELAIRALVSHRIEKFLKKKKNEHDGDLLCLSSLGNLTEVFGNMAAWIDKDAIKSFDLEFKASIKFKDGAAWADVDDFCFLDWPELKEGFVATFAAFKALPVKS